MKDDACATHCRLRLAPPDKKPKTCRAQECGSRETGRKTFGSREPRRRGTRSFPAGRGEGTIRSRRLSKLARTAEGQRDAGSEGREETRERSGWGGVAEERKGGNVEADVPRKNLHTLAREVRRTRGRKAKSDESEGKQETEESALRSHSLPSGSLSAVTRPSASLLQARNSDEKSTASMKRTKTGGREKTPEGSIHRSASGRVLRASVSLSPSCVSAGVSPAFSFSYPLLPALRTPRAQTRSSYGDKQSPHKDFRARPLVSLSPRTSDKGSRAAEAAPSGEASPSSPRRSPLRSSVPQLPEQARKKAKKGTKKSVPASMISPRPLATTEKDGAGARSLAALPRKLRTRPSSITTERSSSGERGQNRKANACKVPRLHDTNASRKGRDTLSGASSHSSCSASARPRGESTGVSRAGEESKGKREKCGRAEMGAKPGCGQNGGENKKESKREHRPEGGEILSPRLLPGLRRPQTPQRDGRPQRQSRSQNTQRETQTLISTRAPNFASVLPSLAALAAASVAPQTVSLPPAVGVSETERRAPSPGARTQVLGNRPDTFLALDAGVPTRRSLTASLQTDSKGVLPVVRKPVQTVLSPQPQMPTGGCESASLAAQQTLHGPEPLPERRDMPGGPRSERAGSGDLESRIEGLPLLLGTGGTSPIVSHPLAGSLAQIRFQMQLRQQQAQQLLSSALGSSLLSFPAAFPLSPSVGCSSALCPTAFHTGLDQTGDGHKVSQRVLPSCSVASVLSESVPSESPLLTHAGRSHTAGPPATLGAVSMPVSLGPDANESLLSPSPFYGADTGGNYPPVKGLSFAPKGTPVSLRGQTFRAKDDLWVVSFVPKRRRLEGPRSQSQGRRASCLSTPVSLSSSSSSPDSSSGNLILGDGGRGCETQRKSREDAQEAARARWPQETGAKETDVNSSKTTHMDPTKEQQYDSIRETGGARQSGETLRSSQTLRQGTEGFLKENDKSKSKPRETSASDDYLGNIDHGAEEGGNEKSRTSEPMHNTGESEKNETLISFSSHGAASVDAAAGVEKDGVNAADGQGEAEENEEEEQCCQTFGVQEYGGAETAREAALLFMLKFSRDGVVVLDGHTQDSVEALSHHTESTDEEDWEDEDQEEKGEDADTEEAKSGEEAREEGQVEAELDMRSDGVEEAAAAEDRGAACRRKATKRRQTRRSIGNDRESRDFWSEWIFDDRGLSRRILGLYTTPISGPSEDSHFSALPQQGPCGDLALPGRKRGRPRKGKHRSSSVIVIKKERHSGNRGSSLPYATLARGASRPACLRSRPLAAPRSGSADVAGDQALQRKRRKLLTLSLVAAVSEAGCGRSGACARDARKVEGRLSSAEGENPRKIFRDRLYAVLGRDVDDTGKRVDAREVENGQVSGANTRVGELLCRNHLMTGSFVPTGDEWLLDNVDDLEREPFSAEPLSSAWYLMQVKLHALNLSPQQPLSVRGAQDLLASHGAFYFHSPYSQGNFLHRLHSRFASQASAPAPQPVGSPSIHFQLPPASIDALSFSHRLAGSAYFDSHPPGRFSQREQMTGSLDGRSANAAERVFPFNSLSGPSLSCVPPVSPQTMLLPFVASKAVHGGAPGFPPSFPSPSSLGGTTALSTLATVGTSVRASRGFLPPVTVPHSLMEKLDQLHVESPVRAKADFSAFTDLLASGKMPENPGAASLTPEPVGPSFPSSALNRELLARLLQQRQGGEAQVLFGAEDSEASLVSPPSTVEREKKTGEASLTQSQETSEHFKIEATETGKESWLCQSSWMVLDVSCQSQQEANRRERTSSVRVPAIYEHRGRVDSSLRERRQVPEEPLRSQGSGKSSFVAFAVPSDASKGPLQHVPRPAALKNTRQAQGDEGCQPDLGHFSYQETAQMQLPQSEEVQKTGGLTEEAGSSGHVGPGRKAGGGEMRKAVWQATEEDQLRSEFMAKQRELIAQSKLLERQKVLFSVEQGNWPEKRKERFQAHLIEKQRELLQSIERQKERLLQIQLAEKQKRNLSLAQAATDVRTGEAVPNSHAEMQDHATCGRGSSPQERRGGRRLTSLGLREIQNEVKSGQLQMKENVREGIDLDARPQAKKGGFLHFKGSACATAKRGDSTLLRSREMTERRESCKVFVNQTNALLETEGQQIVGNLDSNAKPSAICLLQSRTTETKGKIAELKAQLREKETELELVSACTQRSKNEKCRPSANLETDLAQPCDGHVLWEKPTENRATGESPNCKAKEENFPFQFINVETPPGLELQRKVLHGPQVEQGQPSEMAVQAALISSIEAHRRSDTLVSPAGMLPPETERQTASVVDEKRPGEADRDIVRSLENIDDKCGVDASLRGDGASVSSEAATRAVEETWKKKGKTIKALPDRTEIGACGGEAHEEHEKATNETEGEIPSPDAGSSVAWGHPVGMGSAGASCSRAQAGISSVSLPSLSSSIVSPFSRLCPGPPLASVAASTSLREAPVETPFSPWSSSLSGYVEAEKELLLGASKGNTRANDRDRAVAVVPGIVGSDLISAALRAAPTLWNVASLSALQHLLFPALQPLMLTSGICASGSLCVSQRAAQLANLFKSYPLSTLLTGAGEASGGSVFPSPASLSSPLAPVSPRPFAASALLPQQGPTSPWTTKGEDSAAVLRAPVATAVGTSRTFGTCVKAGNEKKHVNDKGVKGTGDVESRHAPSIPHLEKLVDLAMVYSGCLPPCDSSQGVDGERGKRNAGAKRKHAAPVGQGESQERPKALHDRHPLRCVWYLESSPATNVTLPSESGSLKSPSSPSKRAPPDRVTEVSASLCKEKQKGREGPREGQWCCSWSFPRGRPAGTTFSVKLFGYEEAKRLALYTALYAYSPKERREALQELIDEVLAAASSTSLSASRLPNPERFSSILELQPQPLSPSSSLSPSLCVRLDACAFPLPVLSGSPLRSSPGPSSRGRSRSKAAQEKLSIDRDIRLSSQSSASSNATPSQCPQRWQAKEAVRTSLLSRSSVLPASRRREGGNHGEAEAEAKRSGRTGEKTDRRDKGSHPQDLSVIDQEANRLERSHSSGSRRSSLVSSIQVQLDERSGGRLLRGFRGDREEGKRASRAKEHVETKTDEVTGRRKGVSGGAIVGDAHGRRPRKRAAKEAARETDKNGDVSDNFGPSSSSLGSLSLPSASVSSSMCDAKSAELCQLSVSGERSETASRGGLTLRSSRLRTRLFFSLASPSGVSPPDGGETRERETKENR
ncbi:UNVERIFIED_CONTAM: hypothetical protein HHA_220520 [Hammondia hammondi]|eukprot:XP_008887974.1 hypothetical protein HHA_220520 [Hammondia hammondi]